jgi:hypothetical protein
MRQKTNKLLDEKKEQLENDRAHYHSGHEKEFSSLLGPLQEKTKDEIQ